MKINPSLLLICILLATAYSQTDFKRSRGDGMYRCESANTTGPGDIWIGLTALGFLWDSDPRKDNLPSPFAFPEFKVDVGIHDIVSVYFESRLISYGWKFDHAALGGKFTFLKNKDIRFQQAGLLLEYSHRFLDEFHTSIAGFQDSHGTGFSPEGFIVTGSNATLLALYDLDFIAKFSWLPLKVSANLGLRAPFSEEYRSYIQYLARVGVSFITTGADVFIEYSFDAFVNNSTVPKKFSFNWEGWGTTTKTWEVAFSENPMYLTVGGRVRYPSGLALFGAVPLLLSKNQGSTTAYSGKENIAIHFPDEGKRGISDGFDPWYAKWKIIINATYPLRYRQTSAEMRRSFLLLKNKKGKTRIDIDKRLNLDSDKTDQQKQEEDNKKRLDNIDKRRKEIEQSK